MCDWTKNPNCWEMLEKIWWKFNREVEFLTIFEKLSLKLEISGITSFFYNNFPISRKDIPMTFPPLAVQVPMLTYSGAGMSFVKGHFRGRVSQESGGGDGKNVKIVKFHRFGPINTHWKFSNCRYWKYWWT